MSNITQDQLESFLNDRLKLDLGIYEAHLKQQNSEIVEYNQLKQTIAAIQNDLGKSLKTQVNIGGDFFMQAKVPNTEKILVNVGCNVYLELTLEEAAKFGQMKINILEKQAEVIREEVCKIKAHIKMTLLAIGEVTELLRATWKERDYQIKIPLLILMIFCKVELGSNITLKLRKMW